MFGIRYIKKAIQLGPVTTLQVIEQKIRGRLFYSYWRNRALQKKAHYTWLDIQAAHDVAWSCVLFTQRLKNKVPEFLAHLVVEDTKALIDEADNWVQRRFSIVGSAVHTYANMPWHEDIRLKLQDPEANYVFPHDTFYQDVVITAHKNHDTIGKDIKVPWELSRFQHLFALSCAYKKTKNIIYAQTCIEHIDDWIRRNPYMLGVNWVCPMEVALRALNWIVTFFAIHDAPTIGDDFWERFVCSLYDHMHFLEHNWEVYDGRTSNHYLSDLVGYFYLCYFFQELPGVSKKASWCFTQIVRECEKQVFAEGTSYEGSTAYHRLVTELFVHAYMVAQEVLLPIPVWFEQRIKRMLEFIDWCSYAQNALITIGDNDSGLVTRMGIPPAMQSLFTVTSQQGVKHFASFGLSVIKQNAWHVSLRHYAYQDRQPSGHFHNDVGSITVALDGIPLFVDPGSYVYTASAQWRNHFRSVSLHNSVYVEDTEPVALDDNLFKLALEHVQKNQEMGGAHSDEMYTEFKLKNDDALYCKRSITLSNDAKILLITDRVYTLKNTAHEHKNICWNFTLDPHINVMKYDVHTWHLFYNERLIAICYSPTIALCIQSSWVSPSYGVKVPTLSLKGIQPNFFNTDNEVLFRLTRV